MSQPKVLKFLSFAVAISLASTVIAAKPEGDDHPGKGKAKVEKEYKDRSKKDDKYDKDDKYEKDDYSRFTALNESEQDELSRLILGDEFRDYSANQRQDMVKSLPKGLQKKLARGGELPPGWQKKFQRGEVLDAETYRNAERLPTELLNRITGRNDAVELLQVGDRILRVTEGRGTILDVIDLTDRAMRMLGQ